MKQFLSNEQVRELPGAKLPMIFEALTGKSMGTNDKMPEIGIGQLFSILNDGGKINVLISPRFSRVKYGEQFFKSNQLVDALWEALKFKLSLR